jgi:hypothetical protein
VKTLEPKIFSQDAFVDEEGDTVDIYIYKPIFENQLKVLEYLKLNDPQSYEKYYLTKVIDNE